MDNNYTYEIIGEGYLLKFGDRVVFNQLEYIPYPGETMEESAQNHINQILSDNENPLPEQPNEIEQLKAENVELKLALAELAEAQELNKINTQLALAELAEMMTGGDE